MYSTRKANMFGFFFVLHFLAGSLLLSYVMDRFNIFTGLLSSIGASQVFLVFMPVIYYFFFYKTPTKKTLRLYKPGFLNLVLSGLLALFSIPLVMLVNVLSQFVVAPALDDTLTQIGSENFFLALLVIAVFPALFEELISRGIIMSHYKHKKLATTCLISGFFFGMMHLNLNQFLYAFVLGSLFALVVHLTGSIVSSMLMHFIINGSNLALAYVATSDFYSSMPGYEEQLAAVESMSATQQLVQVLPVLLILVLMTLPVIAGILFALMSINDKQKLVFKNAPSKDFFPQEDTPVLVTSFENIDDSISNINSGADDGSSVENVESTNNIQLVDAGGQRVVTVPFVLTITFFLVVSLLTEFLSRT